MNAAVIPLRHPAVPLPPPASPAALEWADRYATRGLRPMVVRTNGKAPLAAGWQSVTLDDTRAQLVTNPGANIGIAVPPGFVVLDVDVKAGVDGPATLAAFELTNGALPPTLRAKTQSGGAHLWFKLPEGVDVPNAVGIAHGLDTRAGGKGFVLAEPSVIDGRAYRWENWGADIAPAPDWLLRAMLSARPAATQLPAPGESLRIPAGMRNHALFDRACAMRKVGFPTDLIHSAVAELNERACDPPVPDQEVRTIVESASRYDTDPTPWEVFTGGAPLPAGATLERPKSAEWAIVSLQAEGDQFQPLPHVVDRWIPQDEVTLLAGHGGGGKSYVALSVAVHVALGRPFGPLTARRAKVLFYSAEDGGKVLQARLARICRSLNIAAGDLQGALTLLDASDIDPALFRKDALPALDRLGALVAEHGAELVVIDNASDAFDGDEIKRAEVRAFIRALRAKLARPGRAVLLLAHINKMNASGARATGAEDYSGSTAWHNSVRSRLSLKGGVNDSFTIEHAKANHGPKADPVQLDWREGVPIVASSVPLDGAARAERREQQRQSIVEIIRMIEGRGARVPAARTGPASTFKTLSADAAFPSDVDTKTLEQYLNWLQDEKHIHRKVIKTPNRKEVEVYSCTPD